MAEQDKEILGFDGSYSDDYNTRYAAMDLAVKYMGGRGAGWPNLKQLATQIDLYLREGR